ncbi:NAD-dependent epimerase/dehydratase [Chthoniobacter flavus Ellin428]|uniref:NAD-dependent epimerase/dehydratase n=1 Tax=Chthoniobacter flavus Ellin428 TaxID=497964 RepID=B4DAW9_9BACT|nr:NAD(P)-dependent oxidoreductase [Chthoniobacter flavus]EDY16441.1 NAD-dependent epimerase/dehydratase [Chthoniobacter flavus Ellin428]TCO84546.1 nucleoside-diphosphate-sugar epimerase [Chthoniobacter flavus]
MNPPETIDELEERLSRPTAGVRDALQAVPGDFLILGASGKMGPTLARMVRRGLDEMGHTQRRVVAVSRFSSAGAVESLEQHGLETIACDLLKRDEVDALPDAPNIIFMVGQKFGTGDAPERTWAMNTIVPALVVERFSKSRIVVFSSGCVYPLMPVSGRGAREDDPLTPPGEYANSCVGRERVFEHFAKLHGTHLLLFRLCYAIDLRYGVLIDVAQKVATGQPVDVTMGFTQVIWQGDANARAIQCLAHTASPPMALNVTGPERISIRELAQRFGERLGRTVTITGEESPTAWLWDVQRSDELFGPPAVSLDEMIDATAHWLKSGGQTIGKPTHFEVRDGRF